MLRDEYGMPSPWSLSPVVGRLGRRQSLGNELARMAADHIQSAIFEVRSVLWIQPEARAEG